MSMAVKAGFDPNQVRDPHTGEWVDTPGDAMPSLRTILGSNPLLFDDSLDAYRTTAYVEINNYLRDPEAEDDPQLNRLIAQMDELFAEVPTTEAPVRTYRGLSESLEEIFPQLSRADLVGKVIDETAFSSTAGSRKVAESFSRQFAGDGDLLEMTVRPGVRGVVTSGKENSEALLERDLSYRITGVRVEDGQRIIEMEVFR